MSTVNTDEAVYSVGQVAAMLGCSVRSLYRWEKSGAIPAPTRIDRGGVSARVYSQLQVEEIREKVKGRIVFTNIVRERPAPTGIRQSEKPRRKVSAKKNSRRDQLDERRKQGIARFSLKNEVPMVPSR